MNHKPNPIKINYVLISEKDDMLVLDVLSRKRLHASLKENVFKGPFKKLYLCLQLPCAKYKNQRREKKQQAVEIAHFVNYRKKYTICDLVQFPRSHL